jgi:hypothetical protein
MGRLIFVSPHRGYLVSPQKGSRIDDTFLASVILLDWTGC